MSHQRADEMLQEPLPAPINHHPSPRCAHVPQRRQHLLRGGLAGLGAAALGAVLWVLVAIVTHYQIGWLAVGVGWLVGITVRRFGKGTEPRFGIVGAGLALLSCLAGNMLAICLVATRQGNWLLIDLLTHLTPTLMGELLRTNFSPADLLFYGLAGYEGYKFSWQPAPTPPRPLM